MTFSAVKPTSKQLQGQGTVCRLCPGELMAKSGLEDLSQVLRQMKLAMEDTYFVAML